VNLCITFSALFLLLVMDGSITAKAQTPVPSGSYQIMPLSSSTQCIDVAGPSKSHGAPVQLYDCGTPAGSPNQVFQLVPMPINGISAFQIISTYSGLCVDVDGVSNTDGAHLQQWDCGGASALNQLWMFQPFGASFELVSLNSTKCLDLPGGNDTHGTQLQQWDCGNGSNPNQLWNMKPVSGTIKPSGPIIPSSFFGMTVLNFANASPSVAYGAVRTWDAYPAMDWATLNPARGVYNFTDLDQYHH